MDINRQSMNSLFTGFKQNFANGLGMAPDTYNRISTVVPSSTAIEEYPFLEAFGSMREWFGPRQIKNLASQKLTLANREFEDTVAVPRASIEDDTYGLYGNLVTGMGRAAGKLWNDLAYAALVANGNWLDGNPFFGTTRKYGTNTISNYTASALTGCTFSAGAVTAGTYRTARVAMMSYLGHNDKALGVIPNLLVVGPKLEATARTILQGQSIAGSVLTGESSYVSGLPVSNPDFGTAELLVSPDLVGTYDDYWFLLAVGGVLNPVIVQQRKQAELIRKDRVDDDEVFFNNRFVYGTYARGAAALTMPHLAYAGIVA